MEYLVVILSLLLYGASLWMVYRSVCTVKIITPAILFFLFYSIFIYFGSLTLYLTGRNTALLMTVSAGIFFFGLGVFGQSLILRFRPAAELSAYFSKTRTDGWTTEGWTVAYVVLFAVTLVSSCLFYVHYGIAVLGGERAEELRLISIHGSDYYIHFVKKLLPYVSLIFLAKSHFNRRYRVAAWALAGVTFLAIAGTGFRASVIHFLLMILFMEIFLSGLKLSLKNLAGCFLLIAGVLVLLTFIRYGNRVEVSGQDEIRFLAEKLYKRICLINPINIQHIQAVFPEQTDYFRGMGYWMDLKTLLPGPDVGFSGFMTAQVKPETAEKITMTPTLVGELYGNFGTVGTMIGMFVTGGIIQFFYIKFLRSDRSLSRIVFYAYVFTFFSKVVMQGWGNTVFIWILPILIAQGLLNLSARFRFTLPQKGKS